MTNTSLNTPDNIARAINTTSDPGAYRIYKAFSANELKELRNEALKEYIYFKYYVVSRILGDLKKQSENGQHEYSFFEYHLDITNCLSKHFTSSIGKKLGYGCTMEEMLEHNTFFIDIMETDEDMPIGEGFVTTMGYPQLRYNSTLIGEIDTAANESMNFLFDVMICQRKPDSASNFFVLIGVVVLIALLIYWLF